MTPPDHIGKYEDLNLVGFGTYGSVYKAWDPDLDRYVAIKVMNAQFSQDEGSLARFQSEARFMARVDQHQNVVRVIELGEEERGLYMVMDYYSNGNLENLIRSEGRLSTERTVGFALQIAAGLSAAHDAGIVHRDIKPQNVLLDDDFVCKVSDFGVSASTDRSIYTAVGTPAYMPPEQKLGRRTDARADIYALGVTMYQMLTGVIPDELIQTEVPPDPRGQNPEIPARIVEIIFKAIELDADSRYPTIRDLIDDLNSYEEAEDGGQGTDRQTSVGSSPNASDNGLGNISRRTLGIVSMAAVGVIAVVVAIVAIVMASGGGGDRSFTGMAVGTAGGGLDRISHTIESLASTTVEIPSKTVKVFIPEGAAPLGATLQIRQLPPGSLPLLPPGLIATGRSFEISLTSENGVKESLNNEVMVSVVFEDSDLAEAQGDSDRVVIGHFQENLGEWEELSTGVNWETNTAWAYVDSLSPFALLVRVSDEALNKVIAEEKPDSETNEPVSPSGKETSKSIAPLIVSNEKLPPKADEPPLKPSLSRIGWPILKIVSPHSGNPGDGISISGEGGYHIYSDGRIDESEREFDLYFHDIKIGSISCYNDRCGTTVNVPGGMTPGLYAIVVEGGSSLAFTVDVPAPVPSENKKPKTVVPQQYTLTVNRSPSYGGTVKGGGNYPSRDTATVTATPYQGYTFTGWSGACSGSGRCSVTMSSNKSVTATFSQQQYTLTVNRSPSYGGTVTGGGNYSSGATATVIATPYRGYSFTGWSGACYGSGSCSVTMNSNKGVMATFSQQQQYTLTVNRSPSYGGAVKGGGNYSSGDTATITATPYQGYTFTGWSGACSGSGSCSVTMNSNKRVMATFTLGKYTLTVDKSPSGGGSVTGGGTYSSGATATVTATPTHLYIFTGWSGDCSGSGICTVTMDSNKGVTATFWQAQYTLAVTSKHIPGAHPPYGSVTGGGNHPSGTTVTLKATPNTGYIFSGWSGDCSGSGICTVTMDSNKDVMAIYSQKQQYTLAVNNSPHYGGVVSGGGTYSSGETATVTATAHQGYSFDGWSGSCSGTGSCFVTMDSNKSVTATFSQKQHSLTTETTISGSDAGGSVTGAGIYPYGATVTVTHATDPPFVFTGWYGACSGTGNCTITMDADKMVGANFEPYYNTLTTNVTPTAGGNVSGGGTYSYGATVTVTATPNTGYTFSEWSGDCSGSGSCTVTMNANKNVTATFSQEQQWAFGKDLYSFVDSLTLTPTASVAGGPITMTCSSSGAPYQLIILHIDGSDYQSGDTFKRGMWVTPNLGACMTSVPFSEPGVYGWSSLEIWALSDGVRTYYTPDGLVKDVRKNVVGTHSLNIPAITVTEPPPVWAYGIDKYSFIDTISISPTGGNTDTSIRMNCTATGVPYPRVELTVRNESGHERMFAESPGNWQAYGQCTDAMPLNESGTYNWTKLVLHSTNGNFRTTYTPNGVVTDHDGNVVGEHSLSIPQIVIEAPPTPTPTPGTWAYGIDKYSFIDTISISPTSGNTDTSIRMNCTATGVPYPRVELTVRNESGHERMFAESPGNWQAYGQCTDAMPLNESGTYNWTKLVLHSTNGNFRTTYTPNGVVTDHDGNVVGEHSLSIPQIVIN